MESLKRARKAQGVSLTELAQRSGLHREAIARAERIGTDPRASTVAAIAKALGVPACELLDEVTHHERHRRQRAQAKTRTR